LQFFHLRIEEYGFGAACYWMDLAVPASATLKDLDRFFRKMWLECCGHLSQFRDGRFTVPMSRKLQGVLEPGMKLLHECDEGMLLPVVNAPRCNVCWYIA
jgi:hypothetical protein